MRFGKDHKAIISSLEGDEVEAYVDFLDGEISRHETAINLAIDDWGEANYGTVHSKQDSPANNYNKALRDLYDSAITRHKQDIKDAEERIRQAKMLKM